MITNLLTDICRIRKLYREYLKDARQKHSLSECEADVLLFLHNNPDMDMANQIAEYRIMPKANVSKAVDSLMQKGMLSSVRDSDDRRKIHLKITDNASNAINDIVFAQDKYKRRLFDGFTEAELRCHFEFLQKISQNAGAFSERK